MNGLLHSLEWHKKVPFKWQKSSMVCGKEYSLGGSSIFMDSVGARNSHKFHLCACFIIIMIIFRFLMS